MARHDWELAPGAYFGPLAVALLLRHCTGRETRPVDLDELARRYERVGTPSAVEAARQLRHGLALARVSERIRNQVQAGTSSAGGTSEPVVAAGGASSEAPPRTRRMSVGQVAEKLGCSREWVRRLCRNEQLSATRVGRDWLIAVESVEDLELRRQP